MTFSPPPRKKRKIAMDDDEIEDLESQNQFEENPLLSMDMDITNVDGPPDDDDEVMDDDDDDEQFGEPGATLKCVPYEGGKAMSAVSSLQTQLIPSQSGDCIQLIMKSFNQKDASTERVQYNEILNNLSSFPLVQINAALSDKIPELERFMDDFAQILVTKVFQTHGVDWFADELTCWIVTLGFGYNAIENSRQKLPSHYYLSLMETIEYFESRISDDQSNDATIKKFECGYMLLNLLPYIPFDLRLDYMLSWMERIPCIENLVNALSDGNDASYTIAGFGIQKIAAGFTPKDNLHVWSEYAPTKGLSLFVV